LCELEDKDEIIVELFCDEVKSARNALTNEYWDYAGLLSVPLDKKELLLADLDGVRAKHECDSEIKSNELTHSPKRKTAIDWLRLLSVDKGLNRIFFNVVGINRTVLCAEAFGDGRFPVIYNRFFRTAIKQLLKYCFCEYRCITVNRVYHDKGDMEHDRYFPWHSIYKIDFEDNKVRFLDPEIKFIDSDHRKTKGCRESNFVQFIDLVSGLTSQCLDCTSTNKSRQLVAKEMFPLLQRMMNDPKKVHSSYGHHRKYLVNFFPREKLDLDQVRDKLQRAKSTFYSNRKLLQADHNQQKLF